MFILLSFKIALIVKRGFLVTNEEKKIKISKSFVLSVSLSENATHAPLARVCQI